MTRQNEEDETKWSVPRPLRIMLAAVGGLVGLVLLVAVTGLAVLQTDWGKDRLRLFAIGRVNDLLDGAQLQVAKLDGNVIRGLAFYDVRIVKEDGSDLALIDTVRAGYRLLPLLQRRIRLTDVYVASPRIYMTRQVEGTWDLLEILPSDTAAADTAGGMQIEMDHFDLRHGYVSATYDADRPDSVLTIEGLGIDVGNVRVRSPMKLEVDTLFASILPPGRKHEPVRLAISGTLSDGQFILSGLEMTSPHSRVRGKGVLAMPNADAAASRDLDFDLTADPLALKDLQPLIPSLDPAASLTLKILARGDSRAMHGHIAAALSNGGRLNIDAKASPPGAATTFYRAVGELRDFNPSVLTGDPAHAALINADLDVDLDGLTPERMSGQTALVVFETRYGEYAPDRSVLEVAFSQGKGDVRLRSGLRGASLAVDGVVRPFDAVPAYDLHGRVAHLDVGRFTQGGRTSDVSAGFRVEGTGLQADSATADVQIDLEPSRLDAYEIRNGRITGRLERGHLVFAAAVGLPEGLIALNGTAELADPARYAVRHGEVRNLDVAALSGDTVRSAINGTFAASAVQSEGSMAVDADVHLTRSYYGTYTLQKADAQLGLNDERLSVSGEADFGDGGTFTLTATAFLDEVPSYTVEEATFTGLNVGALTGRPDLVTDLNGTVSADVEGTAPETMTLDAGLQFAPSSIGDVVLEEGSITAAVHSQSAELDAALRVAGGVVEVRADGSFLEEEPSYRLRGMARNLRLDESAHPDSARWNATLNLDGRGLAPESMQLRGDIAAFGGAYQELRMDTLLARFELSGGVVDVDTLLLLSNAAEARAAGRISLFDSLATSDLYLEADVASLQPLRRFVDAEVLSLRGAQIRASVSGPPDRLAVAANADVNTFAYNDIRLADMSTRLDAVVGPSRTLETASVETELSFLAAGGVTIRRTRGEGSYNGDVVVFGVEAELDDRRDGRLAGRLDLRPESRTVTIEDLGLRLDEDRWTIAAPAAIEFGDRVHVSDLQLSSGSQRIALDGTIDPQGMQDFHVEVDGLRVGGFADLIGMERLDGTLQSRIDLAGPAEAPTLDGSIAFDVRQGTQHLGDVRTDLSYEDGRLAVDASIAHATGRAITLVGSLPMDLSPGSQATDEPAPGPVDLRVESDAFPLEMLVPFTDPETIEELEGSLSAQIDVGGSMDVPELDGRFSVTNGRIRPRATDVAYRDIAIEGALENDGILLQRAALRGGDGMLAAQGRIELTELTLGAFEIDVTMDDFLAMNSDAYHVTATGDLAVTGTTDAPAVAGDVRLHNSDFYIGATAGGDVRQVQLTEEDVLMLEEFFGHRVSRSDTSVSNMFEQTALDLQIELERDTWVRQTASPEIAIELTGVVEVQKEPGGEIQLFRTIEVVPQRSYIRQFGKRFNLTSGTIAFNGPVSEMVMNVAAEYEVRSRLSPGEPEAVIEVTLSGRLDDLEFALSSDPPMENTDIVSYIATGRPASRALALDGDGGDGGDGGGLLTAGGELAANELAGIVESAAGEGLGLDVIEIHHDALRGTQIVAGKYVSRQVYVGVNQSISLSSTDASGAASTEVTMEYEMFEWLMLQLLSGTSSSSIRLNLVGKYAFE